MTWIMVLALILAVFAATVWLFKVSRQAWEAIGAALMLGAAGFAWQAHPYQPGSPRAPEATAQTSGAALVAARKQLGDANAQPASNWSVIADGLARNGSYGDAAGVLLGAVQRNPRDTDAWVAMGNDLLAHAGGVLTPAAEYAYQRGAEADPAHPGPSFFMGLALATNGKLAAARATWAGLLARAPKDAAWRSDLAMRLGRLDAFIANQQAAAPPR